MGFYTEEQISMVLSACQELVAIDRYLMKTVFDDPSSPEEEAMWKREGEFYDWVNTIAGDFLYDCKASPNKILQQLERI